MAMRTVQRRCASAALKIGKMKASYGFPTQDEVAEVGYVLPPSRNDTQRTVVFDLHETLVRIEPIADAEAEAIAAAAAASPVERRGAPPGCLASDWVCEVVDDAEVILRGPTSVGKLRLHIRRGLRNVVRRLREDDGVEGVLWTVGGLPYVQSVLKALEHPGSGEEGDEALAFQHAVMSNTPRFEADGKTSGASAWPFLHDCKPLTLLNRPLRDVLQIDDRPEYMRLFPTNALVVPPYDPAHHGDDTMLRLTEILDRLAESDLPIPVFLKHLPPTLARPQEVGNGVVMACMA
eukprot:TRINITY_DN11827_c0_g2_i1.p1 TRINITY_DN11827_c0_g2~~TRINITY_DN11827_c0_g2_i1.p1  ORF type:complete len:292 (+),score=53.42 TRINITY_DN11827_c0_g2_i1:64-939(+)